MALYRANDRNGNDSRFIVAQDIVDVIPLWREKEKHGIHAIFFDLPEPFETVQEITATIAKLSQESPRFYDTTRTHTQDLDPLGKQTKYTSPVNLTSDMKQASQIQSDMIHTLDQKLLSDGFTKSARSALTTLNSTFVNGNNYAQKTHPKQTSTTLHSNINVNYAGTTSLHLHDGISYIFSQENTVYQTGLNKGDGELFSPKQRGALFDRTIWHQSPEFNPDWKEKPRVSYTIA